MSSSHHDFFRLLEQTPDYWLDLTAMEFTGDLQRILDLKGISQSELARRAKTSQPYISKVFSGCTNFTLRTMIKLARAAGAVLHVRLTGSNEVVRVSDAATLHATNAVEEWNPSGYPIVSTNVIESQGLFSSDEVSREVAHYAH